MRDEFLSASAFDLAARLRAGAITSAAVVDAHIERIQEVNGALNALVVERFAEARAEAHAADARLASEDPATLPPLLGVPCTIKEFIQVEGMPHTAGLVSRRDRIAPEDATVVQRLREAGVVVMGLTNVPEGGLWMETHNRIYGRTNNPWDVRRTSGGSSGGEGALVAAGATPFGIGSDIAGSIRIPAAFCGVFGHKPSGRLVPNTGHFGAGESEDSAMLVTGPLTRRASDLMPLLRIIAGPDDRDPHTRPFDLPDPETLDLARIRVLPLLRVGRSRPRQVMRDAVQRVARALEARGARVVEWTPPRSIKLAFEIWASSLSLASDVTYAHVLGEGDAISPLRELLRIAARRSDHTLPAVGASLLEEVYRRLPVGHRRLVDAGRNLRDAIEEAVGDEGVLLTPPYTRPAPRHNAALATASDAVLTALYSVFELPITQVPVFNDARGLPVGVQVVAARGRDHVPIRVALAVEEAFGGWRRAEPTPR
jgi:fatty acid amide hydrolase 2